MVLKFILTYLANNEKLVNKLAESKPIRRAAQIVVHLLNRTSSLSGSHKLPSNSAEFSGQVYRAVKNSIDLEKRLKEIEDKLKKQSK